MKIVVLSLLLLSLFLSGRWSYLSFSDRCSLFGCYACDCICTTEEYCCNGQTVQFSGCYGCGRCGKAAPLCPKGPCISKQESTGRCPIESSEIGRSLLQVCCDGVTYESGYAAIEAGIDAADCCHNQCPSLGFCSCLAVQYCCKGETKFFQVGCPHCSEPVEAGCYRGLCKHNQPCDCYPAEYCCEGETKLFQVGCPHCAERVEAGCYRGLCKRNQPCDCHPVEYCCSGRTQVFNVGCFRCQDTITPDCSEGPCPGGIYPIFFEGDFEEHP